MPTQARIDAPYLRTLRNAVKAQGGEAALAAAWAVPLEKLSGWLSGEVILPVDFYMAALRIIGSTGEKWKTDGLP